MKLVDLAHLVAVINHIPIVINDKSVTNRDEFSILNNARTVLNKKFVEGVKKLNINALFEKETKLLQEKEVIESSLLVDSAVSAVKESLTVDIPAREVSISTLNTIISQSTTADGQLELPLDVASLSTELVNTNTTKESEAQDPSRDSEYLAALKKQKEVLKNQGRSNRKISNDSQKG